jgi:uncharacterized protein involved in oxidation of intracellular sulfur
MRYLFILNDPPYGTERSYNGLRLALSLAKRDGVELRVFLMGDAVGVPLRASRRLTASFSRQRPLGKKGPAR